MPLLVLYTKKIQPYPLGPEDATRRKPGDEGLVSTVEMGVMIISPNASTSQHMDISPLVSAIGPVSMLGEDEDANISLLGSQVA